MSRIRIGPGFLVAAAFIGPGTIVTASRAGAGYGMVLLWAVLFSVVATVILQNMAARVGLAGRRGFAEAIRDSVANRLIRSGVLGLIAVTILIGNAAFQTGNLLGASLGVSLLTGLPQGLLVALVGGLAGAVLMTGTYKTIQNALVGLVALMSVVFCLVAVLSAPSPGQLLSGLLLPRVPPGALLTVLALIGTTVIPYNLFLHASSSLERWPDADRNDDNIRESRRDTLFSVSLGGLTTAAVVIAASPLLGEGADAADAATVAARLEPLLGRAAPVFFGIGLFSAGLTSAITAPLAAAYAAGGALGWGADLKSGRFRLLWGFVLLTGMFCGLVLGASPYQIILLAQAGNAVVLPLTLVLLLIVANRTQIMGRHCNSRLANVLGVLVVLVITGLSVVQLARVLGLAG
ncbi:MAG: Nramp family divalent metal transporter [Acidobacteria bacterium]|nr:Nramp family divalent metal transporter [Acidobacteriota bacterium]